MTTKKVQDDNFYTVQGWMINRLRLKGVSLAAYAIIYGFSQSGENEFTGSLQYLSEFCGGVSKPTMIKALKELTEKNYVLRREEYKNGVMFVHYRVNRNIISGFFSTGKENSRGVNNFISDGQNSLIDGGKEIFKGGKETLHNKENINNNIINNNKNNNAVSLRENEIILYLNEKANTNYRASSKVTKTLIHARLSEGFTVDDFKTVIDKKCAEWIGTEFAQYLRPATLFGTKFESYLNAPIRERKIYGANGIEIKKDVNAEEEELLKGIL